MADTITLKRSAVASKVPLTTDLALGEVAINTYDGKMFIKKDNGTQSIVEIGAGGGATTLDGLTDVTITTPAAGAVLKYDGSAWINGQVDLADTDAVTGILAIGNGGTGATTQTAAFDALSPTTTKGDVIVSNGTDNIRLGVGTDGQVLTADSAQASGVKWATPSGGSSSPSLTPNTLVVQDDFVHSWPQNSNGFPTGVLANAVGNGWFVYTSNSAYPIERQAGEASHPGIVRMSSGNASMYISHSLWTNGGGTITVGSDVDSFTIITRRSGTSTQGFVGFYDSPAASPSSCIGVRFSSSVLYCRCAAGGAATESTFTNGMAANTWVQIDVKRNGSSFEFYRNGTLVQTISTNIPTTQGLAFGFHLTSSSIGSQDVDYMGYKTVTFTTRY